MSSDTARPAGPLSATMQPPEIWFEDLQPGQVYELGTVVAQEQEVLAFAERYDPQWYHLDAEAARDSSWGGVIASGWWTVSAMMRLYVDAFLSRAAPDASPGVEDVRWHRAVLVGDELRARITVVDVKDSSRGPHLGTVTLRWECLRGEELVCSMVGRGWFHRRPGA